MHIILNAYMTHTSRGECRSPTPHPKLIYARSPVHWEVLRADVESFIVQFLIKYRICATECHALPTLVGYCIILPEFLSGHGSADLGRASKERRAGCGGAASGRAAATREAAAQNSAAWPEGLHRRLQEDEHGSRMIYAVVSLFFGFGAGGLVFPNLLASIAWRA